jgi:hypothetical protein
MNSDIYSQIIIRIIKGQEAIIGPVAIEQANRVPDLKIDWENQHVTISGDKVKVIETLIKVYRELFGQISVEVSRESVANLLTQLPSGELNILSLK